MKPFIQFLESDSELHLIQAVNNRKLVFLNNQMIGHIDFIPGDKIIPGSKDRWISYYLGKYKDSKLKINRTTTRTLGTFNSLDKAVASFKSLAQ